MKNSCWTIFDHKFWQFLVLTISFWGYLILTHSHWRPFGSVCNWGIPPQIGHSTGKVIIIHWKVIYTNMFHFHPFSNPLESDILWYTNVPFSNTPILHPIYIHLLYIPNFTPCSLWIPVALSEDAHLSVHICKGVLGVGEDLKPKVGQTAPGRQLTRSIFPGRKGFSQQDMSRYELLLKLAKLLSLVS